MYTAGIPYQSNISSAINRLKNFEREFINSVAIDNIDRFQEEAINLINALDSLNQSIFDQQLQQWIRDLDKYLREVHSQLAIEVKPKNALENCRAILNTILIYLQNKASRQESAVKV